MKNAVRPAGAALAAFAFLAGTAACTTPSAPESPPAASAPPRRAHEPRPPSEQQLSDAATAALTDFDALSDAGTFVLSAAGGIDGSDNRSEIEPGTRLTVEAACAGRGSVTLTVTSGRAETRRHLDCGDTPRAKTFPFTTRADSVFFAVDRGAATRGGLAYLAHRRPASEHR